MHITKRNIPFSGVIIPRGTKLPSKKYPMVNGQTIEKWLANGNIATLNETIKSTKKANKALMEQFKEEKPKDDTTEDVELSALSYNELKAKAVEMDIKYVGKKKDELVELIKGAE